MRIVFARKFVKSLAKIPAPIRERYYERLILFKQDRRHPLLNDHGLGGEWAGHRSVNVTGDYRAIYHEVSAEIFRFVAIGTHPQLYGR
ncbi:type II toxin-antitoxin system mRNA interferase toxin, RelE/StbE family [Candidatus Kaiserbacteria bacterium]|nr:type II toxin-antitoxin system mRNA interferase toxin, RelE/StbE family [Candidatus Kaiserbacteria bacterium]